MPRPCAPRRWPEAGRQGRAGLLAGVLLASGCAGPCAAAPASAAPAAPATLTPAQRQWLAAHQPRWGGERDYGPFIFQGADGTLQGLSVELLQLVQQRTGLRLQAQPAEPLHRLLEAARAGRLDLLTSLRPTPERAAYLLFSRPYVSVPTVLVRRVGTPAQPLSALAGRPVAVGRGYAVEAVVRQRHPQVDWQAVADDTVALAGVAAGRFDAAVADAASVAYILRTRRLPGATALQVGPQIGFDYALSFAVRRDWPQLVAILDAGILAIDPAERQAVIERWIPPEGGTVPAPRAPRATGLALALLGGAGLAALGLWWRRRHRVPAP